MKTLNALTAILPGKLYKVKKPINNQKTKPAPVIKLETYWELTGDDYEYDFDWPEKKN